MKVLKWVAIGVGSVVVLASAIVAAVFVLTAGPVKAADEFLALVGESRYEEAYRSTAPQFQKETSLETFRTLMQRFSLDKFQSASWSSREISGGKGQVQGTITTRDGGRVLATVILVKDGDAWKVYGMQLRPAGAS